jgi:hypothetical protein
MRKTPRLRHLFFLLLAPLSMALCAQESALLEKLKRLPGVAEVKPITVDASFTEGYELRVRQPLDHARPRGKTFLQTVFVAHRDFAAPVVLETEGYAVRGGGRPGELTRLLRGNQVVVEHRFFGNSVPQPKAWTFLTTRQAAADQHRVTTLLKSIYHGKWVSTGVSKGGQTTLFYRYYYPDDVTASVAYVAPVNLAQEDPRVPAFLRRVGTEAARRQIKEFQLAMLTREKEILPLVAAGDGKRKLLFSIGMARAYEFAVLDYAFAFWQTGGRLEEIPPPDAPAAEMFRHLNQVSALFYYADDGIRFFEPFQYQAYTEIGYYGYDISDFKSALTAIGDPSNIILAPRNVPLRFNPVTMNRIYNWLRDHGNNIIYIYGENDPWSATAMELSGLTNAVKVVRQGGAHDTHIGNLAPDQRARVLAALEQWLGIKISGPTDDGG